MDQSERQAITENVPAHHIPSPLFPKTSHSKKYLLAILLIPLLYLLYHSSKKIDDVQSYFYNVMNLSSINQLPFCLMVFSSKLYSPQKIINSINQQKYSNIKVITITGNTESYFDLKKAMELQCQEYSAVVFVNSPLQPGALELINKKFQRQKGWIIYSQNEEKVEIVSFFYRIYELFETNDFNKTNRVFLESNSKEVQTLAFLELCQNFKIKIDKQKVLSLNDTSYFSLDLAKKNEYNREKYVKIFRLSQDFKVNITQIDNFKQQRLYQNIRYGQNLRLIHMNKAIERQQLIFLPANHSIHQVQQMQMNKKYQIDKYKDISKQVRFCVTILSHNNIQNNRYLKVIRSIVQQQYENYHIVFIDDMSNDENMKKTIQYFNKIGFPKNRIQFVQNLDRNYATYNILNAAFNFCDEDDIQLLVDGDDELIGRTPFQVMNSAYQQNPDLWIAYSNYKTNLFIFGISQSYKSTLSHASGSKRLAGTFIGPIRTWRVKLVRSIPIEHHKMKDGNWLDTVYDDAIAHPLVELAGFQRTKYISEINYEYNTFYGGNDDAKGNHRIQVYYEHILNLPVLNKLKSLSETTKNKAVQAELNEGKNKKYKLLKF